VKNITSFNNDTQNNTDFLDRNLQITIIFYLYNSAMANGMLKCKYIQLTFRGLIYKES